MLTLLIVVTAATVAACMTASSKAAAARAERRRLAPVVASIAKVDVARLADLRNPASQQVDVAVRGRVVATEGACIDPLTNAPVAHHRTAVYGVPNSGGRPRLIHTLEAGGMFWLRDDTGWAVVDASAASYSVRGPRGEVVTKRLRRARYDIAKTPTALVERLRTEAEHEPNSSGIAGYEVEQAVIAPGEELTLYGRPQVVQVDRVPEANPSYRQGSLLVPQFAGAAAKVLFSELEHDQLVSTFRKFEYEMLRRERWYWRATVGLAGLGGLTALFIVVRALIR